MSFFDPPKFPEPFKPEPLWQMNTCPTCQNDLVCHDQGECLLRSTPETDAEWGRWPYAGPGVHANFARRLERERNDARELLVSEKATRNAIIAKGLETERQLAEALHKLEIAMAANNDVERIAKERNEAQKAFAIATDQLVQVQGELRQAREENARLREALEKSKEFVQSWGELIDMQYPLWNECMTTIQKALTT